ncbi:hypothetical protein [Agrobacterium radiobacter]|uniref:hypothetical protein n=1 Tax=Agrobacterium radiobacter TaxID=362 RepID=UPI003F8712D0
MCRFCAQQGFGCEEVYDPKLRRGGFVPGANMPPDVILCDGPVLTMDPSQPEVTGVAIRQGVIQFVGVADDALAYRGRATRIIRLDGRALVPGFIATGVPLPERRDTVSLERWISALAKAGYTTVDVANLGGATADYSDLVRVVGHRHRVRLRGAIDERSQRDWRHRIQSIGDGNDLICLEAVRLQPTAEASGLMLDRLRQSNAEGWRVVFDCTSEQDLEQALHLVALASDRDLEEVLIILSADASEEQKRFLTAAGLHILPAWECDPIDKLSGSDEVIHTAMHSLTVEAAHLVGVAGIAGQIRPGLYADFTLMNRSPISRTKEPLQILGTWIEGVPVRLDESHVPQAEDRPPADESGERTSAHPED